MNADRIARAYRWLEYLTFGPLLWRCRVEYLSEFEDAREVLMLGGGDGRFLRAFLDTHPRARIEWVDSSRRMTALAQARVLDRDRSRVRFIRADVNAWAPARSDYDLVVTHFFLDCFDDAELSALIAKLTPHLRVGGGWLVSEFRIPEAGVRRVVARVVIASLYAAFRWTTGLRVRRLPRFDERLHEKGLTAFCQTRRLGGMLISAIYRRTVDPPPVVHQTGSVSLGHR